MPFTWNMLLYKYRSLSPLDHTVDILCNERLYCSFYHELNDPFEGLFDLAMTYPGEDGDVKVYAESSVYDLMELGVEEDEEWKPMRVCSLSSDPSDVRLWGQYAGSCRGVAIEVELDDGVARQVAYDAKLFRHDDDRSYPSILTVLTRKTLHWEYEKEFRIITDEQFWPVAGRIRKVIAGPLCSKDSVRILEKMTGGTIPVVRSKLDRNRLRIEV